MVMGTSDTAGMRVFGRIGGLSNVVPFTYRDGATFADLLYGVRDYMKETMVPGFELNIDELADKLNGELGEMGGLIIENQAEMVFAYNTFTQAIQSAYDAYKKTIDDRVDGINNKTGVLDIQRITLTGNYTLNIEVAWPTNHPVSFVITQGGAGNYAVTLGTNIRGPLDVKQGVGAVTTFDLVPNGSGQWDVVTTDGESVALLNGDTRTLGKLVEIFTSRSQVDEWSGPLQAAGGGPGGVIIGQGAAANIPKNVETAASQSYIAIGRDALGGGATRGRGCIAIGAGAIGLGANPGVENLAIGIFALSHVQGNSEWYGDMQGSRNIGIGSLAGHFLTTGHQNTFIGRDSGHSITSGTRNVALGYRALSCGHAPVGLSGAIENQYVATGSNSTALGTAALTNSVGEGNVGIGADAGRNLKKGDNNVFIGYRAGYEIGSQISENNKTVTTVNKAGTYSIAAGYITVNVAAHGAISGNKTMVQFTSGILTEITTEAQYLTVAAVPSTGQFTLTGPADTVGTGNVQLISVETAVTSTPGNSIVAIGWGALSESTANGGNTTAVGEQAGIKSVGPQNTFLGSRSGFNLVNGGQNTFVGYNAGRAIAAVGGGALDNVSNVTAIGAGAGATASNQVQLGDGATTTYAYGAVQSRSDKRDKTDIRDTVLGLDFIESIRPVDFKYDYRETDTKGSRFHHGVIAQEVADVIKESGTDFGGFQDHSVNGGADVLSVGYTEFIAPLIKAVQELSARVKELENN